MIFFSTLFLLVGRSFNIISYTYSQKVAEDGRTYFFRLETSGRLHCLRYQACFTHCAQ